MEQNDYRIILSDPLIDQLRENGNARLINHCKGLDKCCENANITRKVVILRYYFANGVFVKDGRHFITKNDVSSYTKAIGKSNITLAALFYYGDLNRVRVKYDIKTDTYYWYYLTDENKKGGYMSSKKLLMSDELINILVESGKAETYVIHKSDSKNGLLDRDETRLLLIYGTEVPGLYVMDSFNNNIYTYYKAKNDSVSMEFKKLRDADKSCIKIYYSYINDEYSWVYDEP